MLWVGLRTDGIAQFYPSYPSAAALTREVLDDVHSDTDIMHIRSGLFEPQLRKIMSDLPGFKAERPHGPKAVLSAHDTAALTSEPELHYDVKSQLI